MTRKNQANVNHGNGNAASGHAKQSARAARSGAHPSWHGRTLSLQGRDVKRFRRLTSDVVLLVMAFHEQGWSKFIDDPLPPKPGIDPKRRLHTAIQNFNRRLEWPAIQLHGDGTGTRVGWETVLPTPELTPESTPANTPRPVDKRARSRTMRRHK